AAPGAGDAVGDRTRLTARAAPDHLDGYFELALGAGDAKGRQRGHLQHPAAEVGERVFLVDRDPALAWLQTHARDRVLPAAGASIHRVSQSSCFLSRRR